MKTLALVLALSVTSALACEDHPPREIAVGPAAYIKIDGKWFWCNRRACYPLNLEAIPMELRDQ